MYYIFIYNIATYKMIEVRASGWVQAARRVSKVCPAPVTMVGVDDDEEASPVSDDKEDKKRQKRTDKTPVKRRKKSSIVGCRAEDEGEGEGYADFGSKPKVKVPVGHASKVCITLCTKKIFDLNYH